MPNVPRTRHSTVRSPGRADVLTLSQITAATLCSTMTELNRYTYYTDRCGSIMRLPFVCAHPSEDEIPRYIYIYSYSSIHTKYSYTNVESYSTMQLYCVDALCTHFPFFGPALRALPADTTREQLRGQAAFSELRASW